MSKILLTISLTILSLCASAQVTYVWRYYSTTVGSLQGYYSVAMPSDSATNPAKRPAFFFFPGTGETGLGNTTEANATKYGTSRDLKLGHWNGAVKQGNGYTDSMVNPIYVVIQQTDADASVGNVSTLRNLFNTVKNAYPLIDTNQMHVAGLSLGGREILLSLVNYGGSAGANAIYANGFASAFIASAGGKTTNITDNAATIAGWAQNGGRMFYAVGANDISTTRYDTATIMNMMNSAVPGSAMGRQWTFADGFTTEGHGGWDTLWRFNRHWYFLNGLTPFEWQLQFTKTPKAVAQSSITTTGNSIILNGVSNGWYKTVAWSKVSGSSATITSPNSDTTTITGLAPGTYTFRMTVTNTGDGRTATHDVTVSVLSEPELPEKYFIKEKRKRWLINKAE